MIIILPNNFFLNQKIFMPFPSFSHRESYDKKKEAKRSFLEKFSKKK
jgi:hypothetical protein